MYKLMKEKLDKEKINCISFSIRLYDTLQYLEKNSNDYKVLKNNKKSKLDDLFMYDRKNVGMSLIITEFV